MALIVLIFFIIAIAFDKFQRYATGGYAETIFKIDGCVRDDEMGVTYKVLGTAKGNTVSRVVVSDKYPSSETYKVGSRALWPRDENPQKLYSIKCP